MAIFNELAASAYIYIMLLLTDFWGENDLRDSVGWALLVFLIIVVSINFLKVLKIFSIWAFSKLKKFYITKIAKKSDTVSIRPGNS